MIATLATSKKNPKKHTEQEVLCEGGEDDRSDSCHQRRCFCAAASATAMRTHAINLSSFLFSVFPAHNFKTPALLGRRPLGTHLTFIAL
jgi:hypothetical protein